MDFNTRRFWALLLLSFVLHGSGFAADNPTRFIQVSADGNGFVDGAGEPFTPLGFNYDRDYKMRLLEEYWEAEWKTVENDFREMKALGANVVRIHLQFAKFMDSAEKPNKRSLAQLRKLLTLAEKTGLCLDLTGLACYRKADVPVWFDNLSEKDRWVAQANFWEAIAKTSAKSPAVFCYDLINEPFVPGQKRGDWLVGELAGFWYVQAITRDPAGRKRSEIARQWARQMSEAIRKHDRGHLITVGLLPNSTEEKGGSGFIAKEIAPELDFISVHIYPKSGKLDEDLALLKKFSVGKPVVIEEMFPMHCTGDELLDFVKRSRPEVSGFVGFYWGQTPEELAAGKTMSDAFTRNWLMTFGKIKAWLQE